MLYDQLRTYREEDGDLEEVDLPHHLLEHHFVDGGARGRGGGEDDGDEDLLVVVVLHVGQQRYPCGAEYESHHPHPHELLSEHHPGQEVHEGGVGGEEGGDDGAVQGLQGLDVEVVGGDGDQAEHNTAGQQTFYKQKNISVKNPSWRPLQ